MDPTDAVTGFTEGKPYAMEAPNGRSFVTNQYALVAHGKAEREFPFIACSDSPFTEVCLLQIQQPESMALMSAG